MGCRRSTQYARLCREKAGGVLDDNNCKPVFICSSNECICKHKAKVGQNGKCTHLKNGSCTHKVAILSAMDTVYRDIERSSATSASDYVKSYGWRTLTEFSRWCGVPMSTLNYKWRLQRRKFKTLVEEFSDEQ